MLGTFSDAGPWNVDPEHLTWRRGLAGDVDQIRRRLALRGPGRATIVITRASGRPWGLICADVPQADVPDPS